MRIQLLRQTFAELCALLQPEDFLPCLLTVLGDLSDLLCSFYRLEKCFFALLEESESQVPVTSPSLSQHSYSRISVSRQALWNRVQDQIGALLAGVTINSKSKMQVSLRLLKIFYLSASFRNGWVSQNTIRIKACMSVRHQKWNILISGSPQLKYNDERVS